MLAGEYCNRNVAIVGKSDSIIKAAKLMREHHVGNVVVVESSNGETVPVSILTDRDIVISILANDVNVLDVNIQDVVNFNLITAYENDDLMSIIQRMRFNGIRRIPIVNKNNGLVGVLAVDDIIDLITEQLVDIDQTILNEQTNEKTLHS